MSEIWGPAKDRRTHCAECSEELWGYDERFGVCMMCQREEWERLDREEYEDWDEDLDEE